jgi:hypothetical protein
MKRVVGYVRIFACVALLCAAPPAVRAELFFVPIDGSSKDYAPEDFGYRIDVIKSGGLVHVKVELDEAAAKSFQGGRLRLTKGRDDAVEVTLGLARQVGQTKPHPRFAFDPKAIDGGEAILYSHVIPDRKVTRNFGGFSLSVQALLVKAK